MPGLAKKETAPKKPGGRVELTLPWPPTTNHCYPTAVSKRTGRPYKYLSAEGKQFQNVVKQLVFVARCEGRCGPKKLLGRLHVSCELRPPDAARRDLDNFQKAIWDALKEAQVYADDSQIDQLLVVRGPIVRDGAAVVSIEEVYPGSEQLDLGGRKP